MIMAGTDSWLSVKEAAAYLGKSTHWLYQNREPLQIPSTSIGGSIRFEKSQIDEWILNRSQVRTKGLKSSRQILRVKL
jgi:excisionase family DNA binding protein